MGRWLVAARPMLAFERRCTGPFFALTRRANQRHIVIIADIKLAPVNRRRAFSLPRFYPQGSFKLSNLFHCIFSNLLTV
jgi:hypothetical protein